MSLWGVSSSSYFEGIVEMSINSFQPLEARRFISIAAMILAGLGLPSVAKADAEPPTAPAEQSSPSAERQFDVSLTFSPFHLLLPVFEVTGEVRAGERIGVAIIGGYGSISDRIARWHVYEVGGQFRYYAIGDFNQGFQVGAEVLHVGVSSDATNIRVAGAGNGVAAGPFVGYKLTAWGGFTFDVQGGLQYMFAIASSDGESAEGRAIIPLLNLNLGWSF